jgi:antitoxin component YwqK of YwqJK toxin-antitoxin module
MSINYTDEKGLKQGRWEVFHAPRKSEEGDYIDGVREGGWRFYDDSGFLIKKGNYRNGRKNGLWEKWHMREELRGGELAAMGEYYDDVKVGDWLYQYVSGEVEASGKYVNGKRDGVWKTYNDESNFVCTEVLYENGEWVREVRVYYN